MTLVNDKTQPVERRRGGVDLQGRGETYSVGEGAFTIRDSDARRDERLVTPHPASPFTVTLSAAKVAVGYVRQGIWRLRSPQHDRPASRTSDYERTHPLRGAFTHGSNLATLPAGQIS